MSNYAKEQSVGLTSDFTGMRNSLRNIGSAPAKVQEW
jgi:hypothetical protein